MSGKKSPAQIEALSFQSKLGSEIMDPEDYAESIYYCSIVKSGLFAFSTTLDRLTARPPFLSISGLHAKNEGENRHVLTILVNPVELMTI